MVFPVLEKQLLLVLCSGLRPCWLSIKGTDEAVHLEAGDFIALPHGQAFLLASDLAVSPVGVRSVVTGPLNGRIVSWQGGGACLSLTAFFTFATEHAGILLCLLPPLVHIRSHADRAVMHWYLERMIAVLRNPQAGGVLLSEYLAEMMLIELGTSHEWRAVLPTIEGARETNIVSRCLKDAPRSNAFSSLRS